MPSATGPQLRVRGGRPLVGSARLPGDKSISHRALILTSLADGSCRIEGLSTCHDVGMTRAALEALGLRIEDLAEDARGRTVRVHGRGLRGLGLRGPAEAPSSEAGASERAHEAVDETASSRRSPDARPAAIHLDCGDSGTTMRLLAGALSGQSLDFVLDGAPGLRRRPMARVVEPLRAMGADLQASADGRPPLRGHGRPLQATEHHLERASAQVGSAILLAGLLAQGESTIHYPSPVRDHSERMLAAMGAPIRWDGRQTRLSGPLPGLYPPGLSGAGSGETGQRDPDSSDAGPSNPGQRDPSRSGAFRNESLRGERAGENSDGHLDVPGDISAAAFLLAAAALLPGSDLRLPAVGINPGRTGILEILETMGAPVELAGWSHGAGEPRADLRIGGAGGDARTAFGPPPGGTKRLRAGRFGGALVPRAIDELPLLAVLATQAEGQTLLEDAAELRVKECDRIRAIVGELRKMGAQIQELPDGFLVEGPTILQGAALEGHGDHRIVMALAVAGLIAQGETLISGAERIADSFPGFVEALQELGADLDVIDMDVIHESPT